MSNEEMQDFQEEHGMPMVFGMRVTIKEDAPYASEWLGEFIVTGIAWDFRNNKMDITLSESWSDPGCDGWKPSYLQPVTEEAG